MLRSKIYWKKSPLSRDPSDHENFVRGVVETLSSIIKKEYKIRYECTGFDIGEGGPIFIRRRSDSFRRFEIQFSYIDCIPTDNPELMTSAMCDFLESNGYEFNPITYAIMAVLHEVGHIEYARTMFENDVFDVYSKISTTNRHFVSLVLGDDEEELAKEGVDINYLLSGSEMFCDGFAMTYFRAVTNSMIDKGFPREILNTIFLVEDCVGFEDNK